METEMITEPEAVSKATANAVACSDLLSAAETALRQWEYFSNELRSMDDHPQVGETDEMECQLFKHCKAVIKKAALNAQDQARRESAAPQTKKGK